MDGKIKSYQDLLASWNKLTGSAPRQTALDSEGLNYIGRPMDQLSDEQKEEMFAPQEDKLALEAIAAEQPQEVQEESVEKSLEEPTQLALNDIMNEPEQIALDKISTIPQEAPKKSREEELMDQYLKEKDLYDKQLENAYAAERRSEIAQNVIEGLGKAFIYNKYARVAPPMPINIKPMDMKYVEEAKEKGKNKLDTYKELLSQLKKNESSGLKSQILNYPDRNELVTYDNNTGEIKRVQELGKKGLNEYQRKNIELKEQDQEYKNVRAREANELRKEKQQISRDYLDFQKMSKDELSDTQTKHINALDTTLLIAAQANEALQDAEDVLGPYASLNEKMSNYIPGLEQDPRFTNIQGFITALKAEYIRLQSGTAASDKEVARLGGYIPDVEDKPATFKQKLNNYMNTLRQIRQQEFGNLKKYQGKSFNESGSIEQPSMPTPSSNTAYTDAQEKAIAHVMKQNNISREEAIQALKEKF